MAILAQLEMYLPQTIPIFEPLDKYVSLVGVVVLFLIPIIVFLKRYKDSERL